MDGWSVLERAGELARRGEAFALATVVWRQGPSSGKEGCRAIITGSGELHGWIGGACAEPVVFREARRALADGTARLLLLGTPENAGVPVPEGTIFVPISCQSEGALEVYVEPVLPAPHLVVVGRSPMARALVDLAGVLGWDTTLFDGLDFTAFDADERSFVVIATQGHDDEEVVRRALAARPAYLGLVGSRRRGETVRGYLTDRGMPAEDLARLQVPAGLDLGPTTHREIAVAVLAELVRFKAAGGLHRDAPTTAGSTVDSGARPPAGSTGDTGDTRATGDTGDTAVDPVCGMPVAPGQEAYPLRHNGTTYYFCRAACHEEFVTWLRRETRC